MRREVEVMFLWCRYGGVKALFAMPVPGFQRCEF